MKKRKELAIELRRLQCYYDDVYSAFDNMQHTIVQNDKQFCKDCKTLWQLSVEQSIRNTSVEMLKVSGCKILLDNGYVRLDQISKFSQSRFMQFAGIGQKKSSDLYYAKERLLSSVISCVVLVLDVDNRDIGNLIAQYYRNLANDQTIKKVKSIRKDKYKKHTELLHYTKSINSGIAWFFLPKATKAKKRQQLDEFGLELDNKFLDDVAQIKAEFKASNMIDAQRSREQFLQDGTAFKKEIQNILGVQGYAVLLKSDEYKMTVSSTIKASQPRTLIEQPKQATNIVSPQQNNVVSKTKQEQQFAPLNLGQQYVDTQMAYGDPRIQMVRSLIRFVGRTEHDCMFVPTQSYAFDKPTKQPYINFISRTKAELLYPIVTVTHEGFMQYSFESFVQKKVISDAAQIAQLNKSSTIADVTMQQALGIENGKEAESLFLRYQQTREDVAERRRNLSDPSMLKLKKQLRLEHDGKLCPVCLHPMQGVWNQSRPNRCATINHKHPLLSIHNKKIADNKGLDVESNWQIICNQCNGLLSNSCVLGVPCVSN